MAGVGEMGFPVVAAMCGACVRRGQEEGGAKYAAKCARNAVFDILEMKRDQGYERPFEYGSKISGGAARRPKV